jgi:hypothetical protein
MKLVWLIALAGLSTACAATPSPSPSIEGPSPTTPVQAGVPPGCEPVDLRGPDGEAVDLSGSWAGSGSLAFAGDEVAVFNQIGKCVFGSVTGLDGNVQAGLTNLNGRIKPDFTIDFEVVTVEAEAYGPGPRPYGFAEHSTVVLVIEWDGEGRLRLREDREPGETAQRCIQPTLPCPDPVIWYAVEEGPTS